jgi:hypothetical protein
MGPYTAAQPLVLFAHVLVANAAPIQPNQPVDPAPVGLPKQSLRSLEFWLL